MTIKLVFATIAFALISLANADDADIDSTGNDFELSVLQTTGDNYLSGTATGDGHSVSSNQSGSASAEFAISGDATDLSIQQNDSQDSVSVTNICTDPAGCSISVDQR